MKAFSLPVLRTHNQKLLAGVCCVLISAALYLIPNRLHGVEAYRPLLAVDMAIPFLPGTGWFYASAYALLLWAFFGIKDLALASRFLYALGFAQICAAVVFVLFPVVYMRELAPLPPGTWAIHIALVDFWRQIDTPANCLPSLHVTTNLLSLVAFQSGRLRKYLPLAVLIASLSIVSTLTFKQHYIVDLVAGLALSGISYFVFFVWSSLRFRSTGAAQAACPAQLAETGGG